MKDTDRKKQHEEEWLEQYTLTPNQLKKLFQNKLDRAAQATQVLRKRERESFDDA
jgi:hypothetical protein